MLTIIDEREIGCDLFNAPEHYKVVTVNCVGAMGRGIALACRERYPQIYEDYRAKCRDFSITVGHVEVYEKEGVILLPTKTHFKYKSTPVYVFGGLRSLASTSLEVDSPIALPPLGMASGWLKDWERANVFKYMRKYLVPDERKYVLYLPESLIAEARAANILG